MGPRALARGNLSTDGFAARRGKASMGPRALARGNRVAAAPAYVNR